uniref:Variant surface glycoprotein 784 n=1 Tax=Trypanosoma brucei TaxID=5691 RepID=M4SXS0_9TRYP|nr:variant surface glycoprotein 784 [Trypanosoma brucei]
MQRLPCLTTLIVAFCLIKQQPAAATVSNPIAQTYWKELCKLSKDGEKLAGRAMYNIKKPAAAVESDILAVLKTQTFLQAGSPTLSTAAVKTAGSFAARKLHANLNYYSGTGASNEVKAALHGGRLQGALREFLQDQGTVAASGKGCLSARDASTDVVTTISQLERLEPECTVSDEPLSQGEPVYSVLQPSGVRGGLATTVIHSTFTLTGHDTKCNLNSDAQQHHWLNEGTGVNVQAQAPKLAAGIIQIERTNGLSTKGLAASIAAGDCPMVANAHDAIKAPQAWQTSAATTTIKESEQDEHFKQAARQYLFGVEETEGKRDNELPSTAKASYNAIDKPEKMLLQDINDMPIEGILKKSPNLKKLGDVTDINQLLELYFYYSDLNKQKLENAAKKLQEAEAKTTSKSAEEKEKECNTNGQDKQDECEKLAKDGCVFNPKKVEGKKCTLSEEGKQAVEKAAKQEGGEKDGKHECSTDQDQTSCEEENEGLPPSAPCKCVWITFTDNEGKLPKPGCRSSSFLVNQKLGLMAGAFFLYLEF